MSKSLPNVQTNFNQLGIFLVCLRYWNFAPQIVLDCFVQDKVWLLTFSKPVFEYLYVLVLQLN